MEKLAKPPGLHVTRTILVLITLFLLIAVTSGIRQTSIDANTEPKFTDVRIVEPNLNARPAQGVKISYVPRNEASTFIY